MQKAPYLGAFYILFQLFRSGPFTDGTRGVSKKFRDHHDRSPYPFSSIVTWNPHAPHVLTVWRTRGHQRSPFCAYRVSRHHRCHFVVEWRMATTGRYEERWNGCGSHGGQGPLKRMPLSQVRWGWVVNTPACGRAPSGFLDGGNRFFTHAATDPGGKALWTFP